MCFIFSVSFRKYFSEDYFWTQANIGPLCIGIITAPYWISSLKVCSFNIIIYYIYIYIFFFLSFLVTNIIYFFFIFLPFFL